MNKSIPHTHEQNKVDQLLAQLAKKKPASVKVGTSTSALPRVYFST